MNNCRLDGAWVIPVLEDLTAFADLQGHTSLAEDLNQLINRHGPSLLSAKRAYEEFGVLQLSPMGLDRKSTG